MLKNSITSLGVVFTVIFASPVMAQTTVPVITETTPQGTIQVTEVAGKVLRKDSDSITIRNGQDQVQEFTVPRNIQITRNRFGSNIEGLQPNDSVNLTVDTAGQVLSIDATSGQVEDTTKVAIPVIFVLGLLAIVGYLLYKRSNKGEIKTQAA